MTNMIKNIIDKNQQFFIFCLDTFYGSDNKELEVRFRQNNSKNEKNKNLGIDLDSYTRLNHFFSNVCGYSNSTVEHEFIVNYRNGIRVSQKMIPEKDTSSVVFPWKDAKVVADDVIVKKKIKTLDIENYGIRFAISEETPVIFTNENGGPVLFRTRKRTSYFYENIRVDLSIYKSSSEINSVENSELIFDVELELLKSEDKTQNFPDHLIHFTEQILKIIQETDNIICKNESISVVENYKKLTNSSKFIGCQPETLTETRCINKDPKNYAITVKLDGKRKMLFAKDGKIYTINSKLNVNFTGLYTNDKGMYLVDTEFFQGYYYCFDILFYNGDDIRWQKLDKRLSMLQDFVNKNVKNNEEHMPIKCKEYFFDNILEKISEMKKNHTDGITDGIIVVPVNKGYPFRKSSKNEEDSEPPMKWKPELMNTVDFKIKKISKNETCEKWELLCSGDKKFYYNTERDLGITSVSSHISKNYLDNSVAEFFFDKETEMFVPIKQRHDKLQGNYIGVAVDNFETCINPYDISVFFSKGTPGFKQDRSSFFDTRRFHNWIKRSILDKTCSDENSNNISLLDLCCGKGGDIHKWTDNNIRYVEGYDINHDSVSEAVKRFEKVKAKPATKNFDFNFYQKNLSIEQISPNSNVNFDLATCFFAIHYFFGTQETLDNFARNLKWLKPGKRFIITTLCSDALKKIDYTFHSSNVSITPVVPGKSVKVHIRGTVLDNETEEYIADYEQLVGTMKSHGLELEESKMFSEYYDSWKQNGNFINYSDRAYSFLNRTYIFVKKNPCELQSLCEEVPYLWSDSVPEIEASSSTSIEVSQSPVDNLSQNFNKMTIKELRAYAETVNIFVPSSAKTKKQIIQILQ